jgi:hypothetical protein
MVSSNIQKRSYIASESFSSSSYSHALGCAKDGLQSAEASLPRAYNASSESKPCKGRRYHAHPAH